MGLLYLKIKYGLQEFVERDNRGIGVVEMILILVVLIGLVVIFKSQLNTIVTNVFKTITKKVNAL